MRALKTFLRKRKAEMLWCGDCECRTLKCWREANCICDDDVSPVPPTPTTYTVTITTNDVTYGTVDVTTLDVEEGTSISTVDNVLTIWTTDITATAETGYKFIRWTVGGSSLPSEVTSDITIVANFEVYVPITAIDAPSANTLTLTEWTSDLSITFTYDPSNATHVIADVDIVSSDEDKVRAIIEDFDNWVAALHIDWASQGNATVTYSFGVASYDIDVTVTP